MSPAGRLDHPLVVVLAACVVASSFISLDLEGTLFWGGAAIPHVCAFALLGPSAAAVITAVEEVSVWAVDRYRPRMFPINLFSTLAPNLAAAYVMLGVGASGAVYYALLAGVATAAIALNFVLVTVLVGVFYGEPVIERLARHRRLVGPLAVNIAVAVGAVALYRAYGLDAAAFVAGGVLIFAYVARRVAVERQHLERISEMAATRGRLVAQLLEAEDRERRELAEALHDDVVQTLLVLRQDLAAADSYEGAASAIHELDDALRSLRAAISTTHPSVLARVGLRTALTTVAERYASRSSVDIRVAVDETPSIHHDRLIFSSARELLANVTKHARAQTAEVRVWIHGDTTYLRVADDGVGFDPAKVGEALATGHIGLHALRERAESVGGGVDLVSAKDAGAAITMWLPTRLEAWVRAPERRPVGLARVSQH